MNLPATAAAWKIVALLVPLKSGFVCEKRECFANKLSWYQRKSLGILSDIPFDTNVTAFTRDPC